MAKERYFKIHEIYYPIDSMCWLILSDGKSVNGYRIGQNDDPVVTVRGEDGLTLIAVLNALSLDLALARESNG